MEAGETSNCFLRTNESGISGKKSGVYFNRESGHQGSATLGGENATRPPGRGRKTA